MAKKKQKTTVFRTSISVSPDLKRRMDRVTEEVNWSALACRAFEGKLAEIAATKEKQTMDDVIQRLRSSKQDHESDMAKEGRKAGEWWAKRHARYDELKRVAALRQDHNWPYPGFDSGSVMAAAGVEEGTFTCEEFFGIDQGEDPGRYDDSDFLESFVHGAGEIWDEVEGHL